MDSFIKQFKNTKQLHHAYFFVGNPEEIKDELFYFFQKELKVETVGNPDFKFLKYNSLSIDEAREISLWQGIKNLGSSTKKNFQIFVISVDFISQEAQNSLLKVLEEPSDNTHFFIISPQDILLPTLKSRVQTLKIESEDINTEEESILKLNLKQRLEKVKEIVDAISDEEATKQEAITFLNHVEREIYKKGAENHEKELAICQKTRESLFDRGAPVKMILENLMISI